MISERTRGKSNTKPSPYVSYVGSLKGVAAVIETNRSSEETTTAI